MKKIILALLIVAFTGCSNSVSPSHSSNGTPSPTPSIENAPQLFINNEQYPLSKADKSAYETIISIDDNSVKKLSNDVSFKIKNVTKSTMCNLYRMFYYDKFFPTDSSTLVLDNKIDFIYSDNEIDSGGMFKSDQRIYRYLSISLNSDIYYFAFVTGDDLADKQTYSDLLIERNDIASIESKCHIQPNATYEQGKDIFKELDNNQINTFSTILNEGVYLINNNYEPTPGANSYLFTVNMIDGGSISFSIVDDILVYSGNVFTFYHNSLNELLYSLSIE